MRTVPSRFMLFAAVLFLATMAKVSLRAQNAASSTPTARTEGAISYLMLQDGGLVEGKITSAADWYIVVRPGGQMQVAKSRVVFACHTRDEAYAYRHAQIDSSKPGPHLSLAEWCLRYGLLTESEQELAEARRLDPDQPRLGLLERRLEKMRTQTTAKAVASIAPNAHAKNTIESTLKPSATIDLPDGVVERFTRKVQPILVNSCTTSACHQRGGRQSFQLDRAILRGEANRRSTMHNLEATLALIDRENPEQSQLLIVGRKKHGGMAGPIFGPRQEQAFKHVTEWISLVAPRTEPVLESDDSDGSLAEVVPPDVRKTKTRFSN